MQQPAKDPAAFAVCNPIDRRYGWKRVSPCAFVRRHQPGWGAGCPASPWVYLRASGGLCSGPVLRLETGATMIPNPSKENKLGEDAYFITTDGRSFGGPSAATHEALQTGVGCRLGKTASLRCCAAVLRPATHH